jgi:hypothetical protein
MFVYAHDPHELEGWNNGLLEDWALKMIRPKFLISPPFLFKEILKYNITYFLIKKYIIKMESSFANPLILP